MKGQTHHVYRGVTIRAAHGRAASSYRYEFLTARRSAATLAEAERDIDRLLAHVGVDDYSELTPPEPPRNGPPGGDEAWFNG